jgi:hypothetical protein
MCFPGHNVVEVMPGVQRGHFARAPAGGSAQSPSSPVYSASCGSHVSAIAEVCAVSVLCRLVSHYVVICIVVLPCCVATVAYMSSVSGCVRRTCGIAAMCAVPLRRIRVAALEHKLLLEWLLTLRTLIAPGAPSTSFLRASEAVGWWGVGIVHIHPY